MRGWRDVRRWPLLTAVLMLGLVAPLILSTAASAIPEGPGALPPPDTSEVGATGELPGTAALSPTDPAVDGTGIPAGVLAAYQGAERTLAGDAPGCRLPWSLVAGIGKVESDHAGGGAVDDTGTTTISILGPPLDGTAGNAAIPDTDGGALDGDTVWDRAVGPTQFLPATWTTYGADGNADGVSSPANVFDATVGSGRYLCAGGLDVTVPEQRYDAVFRYNHSDAYVADVLRWADAYAAGVGVLPDPPTDGEALPPNPPIEAAPAPAPGLDAAPIGDPVGEGAAPAAPLAPGSEGLPAGGVPLADGGAPAVPGPAAPLGEGGVTAGGPPPTGPPTTPPSVPRPFASVCSTDLDFATAVELVQVVGSVTTPVREASEGTRTTCVVTGSASRELRVVTTTFSSERAAAASVAGVRLDEVASGPTDGSRRVTVLRANRVVSMTTNATGSAAESALEALAAGWPGPTR